MSQVTRMINDSVSLSPGLQPSVDEPPASPVTPDSSCLYYETLTLLDEVLLPSLSLTESNPCLAEEIW